MSNYIAVTREKFDKFIEDYPRELETNVVTIGEPPLITYNDFTLGSYPNSVVAKIMAEWMGPNGEIDNSKHNPYWEYKIIKGG